MPDARKSNGPSKLVPYEKTHKFNTSTGLYVE